MPVWKQISDKADVPIYRQDQSSRSLFYTPGWIVVIPAVMAAGFQSAVVDPASSTWPEAEALRRQALEARKRWESLRTTPFVPVCLTLYLNNACNLNCAYCFSQSSRSEREPLSFHAIRAAAAIVAGNCQAQQKPMTVVFHGGGEPTLHYDLVRQALHMLGEVARDHHLDLFRYIATNGVLSTARAADLASRFDLIGLSCDGPPVIQDRQRPLQKKSNRTSSWFVERTADAVHLAGKPLHVRVTVTPQTLDRQPEIAEYVCQKLRPQEIHVEPVYAVAGHETGCRFQASDAETYVDAFLHARQIARAYGINWLGSGSRPTEIHGPYCHIWRGVLNLTPEGVATLCFKSSDAESVREQGLDLGHWDPHTGRFELKTECSPDPGSKIESVDRDCEQCFNRYHCVRQCPDVCMLKTVAEVGGFRCRVQSMLADALLQETADAIWPNTNGQRPVIGKISAYP